MPVSVSGPASDIESRHQGQAETLVNFLNRGFVNLCGESW